MVSHLVFYQLGLIALVSLFLICSGLWPSEPVAARPMPPKPLLPPSQPPQKAHALSGSHPQTLLRCLCTGDRGAKAAALSSSAPDGDFDTRPPPSRDRKSVVGGKRV